MTFGYFLWRLQEEFFPSKHPFDRLTGCETSGMVYRRRLGAQATDYQPVDPDVFRATIGHIQADFSAFTFVDLGCGKGRALILAEEFDFDQIVGVEFSRRLAKIAQANAAKIDSRRTTILNQDARKFKFPPKPLVVFLYNPFDASIVQSVMSKLRAHPETLYVAYVNPMHREVVSSELGAACIANDDWCAIWRIDRASPRAVPSQPKVSASIGNSRI